MCSQADKQPGRVVLEQLSSFPGTIAGRDLGHPGSGSRFVDWLDVNAGGIYLGEKGAFLDNFSSFFHFPSLSFSSSLCVSTSLLARFPLPLLTYWDNWVPENALSCGGITKDSRGLHKLEKRT